MAAALLVLGIAGAGWLYTQRVKPAKPVARPSEPPPPARAARPTPLPSTLTTPRPEESAAPAAPRLRITSDVPGAAIFVDRRFVGQAPVEIDPLGPGRHRINASADGYEMQAAEVDGDAAPRVVELRFKEIRLDAKVAVVHKHGIGSCRGTLSATRQGVRYAPERGDHGFVAPLSDLTALDVDYLAKNLRLRLRSGRTFNFTDPSGQADPLLVFQQQVEKARGRTR